MRIHLEADARAPGAARQFVTSQLGTFPRVDDVLVVVSELVTNSVRASATSVDVELRTDRRCVRLRVVDDAAGWPTPRDAGPEDSGGRGLHIVAQLADDWRATSNGRGKSVEVSWTRRG